MKYKLAVKWNLAVWCNLNGTREDHAEGEVQKPNESQSHVDLNCRLYKQI